eukprot:gene6139-12435_t
MTCHKKFYGVWNEILGKINKVEIEEATRAIGKHRIEFNQDLCAEFNALTEILADTRCYNDSSSAFASNNFKKATSNLSATKIGIKNKASIPGLSLMSGESILVEQVLRVADHIKTAIDSENQQLEADIASLQMAIDNQTDVLMSSQYPKTPTTSMSDDISTNSPQNKSSPSSSNMEPISISSLHSLSSLSAPLSNKTTPLICPKCNGRLDTDVLVLVGAAGFNRGRNKTLPTQITCTCNKDNDRKLKKSDVKPLPSSSLHKTEYKKTSNETNINSFYTSSSTSTPSSTSTLLLSIPKENNITRIESYSYNKHDCTDTNPLVESSKFRRRLQSKILQHPQQRGEKEGLTIK